MVRMIELTKLGLSRSMASEKLPQLKTGGSSQEVGRLMSAGILSAVTAAM